MSITRNFKLFLTAGRSIPLLINANQYDQGETWIFTLYNDHGVKYVPSSGAIVGIKSDRTIITKAGTVNASGQVVITETQQMTAAAGKAVFELQIDGDTHGTANFVVLVEPKPTDGGIPSESDLSLIQEALNSVTPTVIAETVSDWLDENITEPTEPIVDASLQIEGAAADAKATGDAIAEIAGGSGLTNEVKLALLACLEKLGWTVPDGQDYYDALELAMSPPAELSYITAVYDQDGKTVYDTDSLDSLKSDLVVTAHYSNSSTSVVTAYTLSGTLTTGTSTITVSYGGKTTTFTVTVTHSAVPSGYTAYDYLEYTGADISDNVAALSKMIATKKFTDLNSLIFDFYFSPAKTVSAATGVLGGHASSTGNNYTVYFLSRTDTKRISCLSHGTALGIDNVDDIAVGNVVHVTLDPGTASPSTLTAGESSTTGAWTSTAAINAKIGFFGQHIDTKATFKNFAQIGTLKLYDVSTNALEGEYIPCKRNSDSVLGYYDTVTETFYTAPTSTYATLGHADCVYTMGNWS